MKVAGAKVSKVKKVKAEPPKPGKGIVFIGARRSGAQVKVSREITKNSATGQFKIIESTIKKLPKTTSTEKLKSTDDWLRNPDLGDRLTVAFGMAVTAAKKRSAKLHK